jgi:DNA-binding NarL/FixJ family response regulator
VVVLTTFELDDYVFGALRVGASGFLLKDMEPAALIEAVRTVAAGDALLAPRVTRRLVEAFVGLDKLDQPNGAGNGRPGPPRREGLDKLDRRLAELTPREREILALVGKGLSNTEIASELVLSPLTVKTHVSRLFLKLNARDRAQCVVIAYESGLVVAGS